MKYRINIGKDTCEVGEVIKAVYDKDAAELKRLIQSGKSIHENNRSGLSFFEWCINVNDLEIYKVAHEQGVISSSSSEQVQSAFLRSISRGDSSLWRWWLKEYPKQYVEYKWKLVAVATDSHEVEFLKMALNDEVKFNINEKSGIGGETLLHIAADRLYYDVFEMLLNHGADPTIKNVLGEDIRSFLATKSKLVPAQKRAKASILKMIDSFESEK